MIHYYAKPEWPRGAPGLRRPPDHRCAERVLTVDPRRRDGRARHPAGVQRRPGAVLPARPRLPWLKQNIAALDLTLTEDEPALLDPARQPGIWRPLLSTVTAPGQYDVRSDRRRTIRATGLGALCRPRRRRTAAWAHPRRTGA